MFHTHTLTLKQNVVTARRPRVGRTVRMNPSVGWTVVLVAGTLVMGALYLFTVNAQSTRGYALRRLEGERMVLINEIRTLDRNVGDLFSIGVIETAAQSMEFVEADDPQYFVPETGVAAAGGAQRP